MDYMRRAVLPMQMKEWKAECDGRVRALTPEAGDLPPHQPPETQRHPNSTARGRPSPSVNKECMRSGKNL